MRRPEPVDQDAEAEVDAATAEEQRSDEEEAGSKHAYPGMGAVREVFVDSARARVLPGVERDRVGDRQHAEAGEQHRERGVPACPDVGSGDASENERDREHRPDRERLRDRVHRGEILLPERSRRGVALSRLAHAITPSRVVPDASVKVAAGSLAR